MHKYVPPRLPEDGQYRPKRVVVHYIVIKYTSCETVVFDYIQFSKCLCLHHPERSRIRTGTHDVRKFCHSGFIAYFKRVALLYKNFRRKFWLNLNKVARVFTPLN